MLCQLLPLFLLAAVAAADWPQWRGSQRDGQIANFSAPVAWPDSLQLQWRTPVGRGDATLSIIEPSAAAWKTLAQYQVADSPTWAHPVVLGDRLLIKDATDLSLWTLPTGP